MNGTSLTSHLYQLRLVSYISKLSHKLGDGVLNRVAYHIYIYIYVCMYVYICVCVFVCVCVSVCLFT